MRHKKIFAALTSVSLMMFGCSNVKNSEESSSSQEVQKLEQSIGEDTLTAMVRTEELSMPEGIDSFYRYEPTNDGFMCIGGKYNSNEMHIFRCNTDSMEWSDTILAQPESYDGYYYKGGLIDFGENGYYSLTAMENHSNMEPYNGDEEEYDWDLYHSTWESDYYLCTYSADGSITGQLKVEGLEEYNDSYGYLEISDFFGDGEHTYLTLRSGVMLRIEPDGTLTELRPANDEFESSSYSQFLRDRDNKVILYNRIEEAGDEGYYVTTYTLSEFDAETGKIGEPFYTSISDEDNVSDVRINAGGHGDHRIFVNEQNSQTGMYLTYGIRDDGTKDTVIDWDASNLQGMEVVPLNDGTFIGVEDYNKLCRVTRKYSSEIKEKQVITMGVLGYLDNDFIHEFNNTHDDYELKAVPYNNSDGSYLGDLDGSNDALDQLKLDVVSDNAPDLIFMGGENDHHDTLLRLGSKGVFCDLYEFIDSDPEINRSTLLPNILTAMEHPNGSLYSFTQGFGVSSIAVKSKFTTKENWTMDDMIALYDGSDDVIYYWSTKQETLKMLMIGTDFTDEINGTCNFDSPEFVKMLEFCDCYPLESTTPEKNYDDEYQMQKFQQWYYDRFMRYQNDTDYVYFTGFSGLRGVNAASAWAYTKSELGGDFTLVGYPSDNGKGGKINARGEVAVLNSCSDKAAAWEVVRSFITSKDISGYSVLNEKFEEDLDNEMYIWNGIERTNDEYYDDDSRVYPLTQKERDGLEEYIRSCDTYMMIDENVKNIVFEEADIYFNGEKSVEETAKAIQSRAEIYLSEQS